MNWLHTAETSWKVRIDAHIMETVGSSETLVFMYQATRRHVPEDDNIKVFFA
jgi:hypothetical protein